MQQGCGSAALVQEELRKQHSEGINPGEILFLVASLAAEKMGPREIGWCPKGGRDSRAGGGKELLIYVTAFFFLFFLAAQRGLMPCGLLQLGNHL